MQIISLLPQFIPAQALSAPLSCREGPHSSIILGLTLNRFRVTVCVATQVWGNTGVLFLLRRHLNATYDDTH